MKKDIKINEKVGYTFTTIGFITMVWNGYNPELYKLLILGACVWGQAIFLSHWGLTTFNDKFKK